MTITIDLSLTEAEAKKLYDLIPSEIMKQFVQKRYVERKTIEETGEEMNWCIRHAFRISNDVKNYALKMLLERLVASEV